MKKLVAVLISFIFLFQGQVTFAQYQTEIYINGSKVSSDVTPFIKDNTTYVPLRVLAEELGCKVDYIVETKKIILTKDEKRISMTVGDKQATRNGFDSDIGMSVPPIIVNNRVMVPLRFLAEAFDCEVKWIPYYMAHPMNEVDVFSSTAVSLPSRNAKISSNIYKYSASANSKSFPDATYDYNIIIPQFSNMKDVKFQDELNDIFMKEYKYMHANFIENTKDEKKNIYGISDAISYSVIGERNGVLSTMISEYLDEGGAHGMQYDIALNIDFNKSKILKLEDIFKPSTNYNERLIQEMQTIWTDYSEEYADVEKPTTVEDNMDCFYFINGNFVFYYYPYYLAPYSRGVVEFSIPLKNLSDILREEYK